MNFSRRRFLGSLALPLTAAPQDSVTFTDYEPAFRVDVQQTKPHVRSFDLRTLTTWQTPAGDFFTFHQTRTVLDVDLDKWRLEVTGSVARPRTFTYAELAAFAARQLPATIECAGNTGHPRIMNGLVSNGVWSGPELAPLLRSCGVLPEAREVVFFGADVESERKWPAGERELTARHGRSIFVQDALEGGAILAMQLNAQPLPPDHGYPVRLILPGWYGMTQVKWLTRIHVLDRRYEGRHMARNYHSIRTGSDNLVIETSITRNRLKSVVARVEPRGTGCLISGAAWGGTDPIERIELRIDDTPWRSAAITRKGGACAWSLWHFEWDSATPGEHTVVSRAIDARGNIQPERSGLLSAREENVQWVRRIRVAQGFRK